MERLAQLFDVPQQMEGASAGRGGFTHSSFTETAIGGQHVYWMNEDLRLK